MIYYGHLPQFATQALVYSCCTHVRSKSHALYLPVSRILVFSWACKGEQVLSLNRDVEEPLQEKRDNTKVGEEFSEKNHNSAAGHRHQDVLMQVLLVENITGLFEYAD